MSDPTSKNGSGGGSVKRRFGEVDLSDEGESLDLAMPALEEAPEPKPRKPSIAKPSLLQDEQWDEDGLDDEVPAMAPPPAQAQARPEVQKLRRPAMPPREARPEPEAPAPEAAPEPEAGKRRAASVRVSRVDRPGRSHARGIKIVLIVLGVLALIAGGAYGFLKWRESVEAEEQAQLDALDQGSLDRLKSDALRKERLGP